jgi:CRISPR system Cascade subunit CasB
MAAETLSQPPPAPDAQEDRLSAEREFVARVQALDRGRQAALKRNAGNTIAQSRGIGWFYSLLRGDQFGRDEEVFFLVATLLAQDRRTLEGRRPFSGGFGQTMRQLAERSNADGVERRFRILLDAEFDLEEGYKPAGGELAFRLRQLVKLAGAKEIGVDWPQLLYDLRRWGAPGKRVQKQWAQSYYSPALAAETAAAENS